MSAVIFRTGKSHQDAAAIWARRRLADSGGRRFSSDGDQDGVLFADSVGMGKTWEALAAAALILYKTRPKKGRRRVLILCPANLISKWEEELAEGSKFRKRLDRWRDGISTAAGRRYTRCVCDTLGHVLPIRRREHVTTRLNRGKFHPPGGTYLVSHGLIGRRGRGLAALRNETWDIIIVDEAHNGPARKAIDAVQPKRRAHTKLLLTATPFQLEPRQWNDLARHIIRSSYRVFSRQDVKCYVSKVAEVFHDADAAGPSAAEVRAAGDRLRLIAARTVPETSRRTYSVILSDGTERALDARLDEFDDRSLRALFDELRESRQPDQVAFERLYLARRLELASRDLANGAKPVYVSNELRRLIARGADDAVSPRLVALEAWTRRAWLDDLDRSFELGVPHKTIVFTSWVGAAHTGEAEMLRGMLAASFDAALDAYRGANRKRWDAWVEAGRQRLGRLSRDVDETIAGATSVLAQDDLTAALVGAHKGCLSRVRSHFDEYMQAVRNTREELVSRRTRDIETRALTRRLNDMIFAADPWSGRKALRAVERYTGAEHRRERDRAATAFRQIGPPWVLVASNVGSEGIDLQTYTRRIVHYDLEWNPARMEQREGRGDRVGRLLKGKLQVFYSLVPGTYDERMFHQLVARDRWHGVLLGKPAQVLQEEERTDAPLLDRKKLRKMQLRLAPE